LPKGEGIFWVDPLAQGEGIWVDTFAEINC